MVTIEVAVRLKPPGDTSLPDHSFSISKDNSLLIRNHKEEDEKNLRFDQVFGEDCLNSDIHERLGEKMTASVYKGEHCCVMAFGQTGSGKSIDYMSLSHPTFSIRLITICSLFFSSYGFHRENLHNERE